MTQSNFMEPAMPVKIHTLSAQDVTIFRGLLNTFGQVFEDTETYLSRQPSDVYVKDLLGGDNFIAIAAIDGSKVIGGLAAYELKKFEQERSEIYIYDLAVDAGYRRQGIATALINQLKIIGQQRNAYVIFVQADKQVEDEPAIALYSKMGKREDVLHFDIDVE